MSSQPSPRKRRSRATPLPELAGPTRAPRPRDGGPAPVLPRSARSHTHGDGTPKIVMSATEAMLEAERLGMAAYLCSQAPEHYHVGRRADR